MRVYRIALTEYCDLSGEGARLYGGRWNLPGYAAIYAGGSVSVSLLERLTIDTELFASERQKLYSVMEIVVPSELIIHTALENLPQNWDATPPSSASQVFGRNMIKQGVLCFGVPSVVDKTSMNYLINPLANGFQEVINYQIYPFSLNRRIVK